MMPIGWGSDVEPPAGATVYSNQLAGMSLEQLLVEARRDWWPNKQCEAEWLLLRNWAIQTESLMLDQAESLAWERRMRELLKRELPYEDWVGERQVALTERARARKPAQTRLRDKYGFKRPRRWGLVVADVRRFYGEWAGDLPAEELVS